MDLKSMLNSDDASRKQQQQQQQHPPALPTLNTAPPALPPHHAPYAQQHQHPQHQHPQQYYHDASPGPHPYAAHYHRGPPPPHSPIAHHISTPIHQQPPAVFTPGGHPIHTRPTLSRSPSSAHDYFNTVRNTPTSSTSHQSASGFAPPALPPYASPLAAQPQRLPQATPPQAYYRATSTMSRESEHPPPSRQHRSPSENRVVRQQSMSVSPKTVLTRLPSEEDANAQFRSQDANAQRRSQDANAQRRSQDANAQQRSPDASAQRRSQSKGTPPTNGAYGTTYGIPQPTAPEETRKRPLDSSPTQSDQKIRPPASKRPKSKEPPIWAQRAKGKRPLPTKSAVKPTLQPSRSQTIPNGTSAINVQVAAPPTPLTGSTDLGLLGQWDPTFTNIIPHEEVTRQVCNFLIGLVANNKSIGGSEIGEVVSSDGQLEIEARLGSIIDRSTNERISLPVMTETIINPNYDISFESFMSGSQHMAFNEFLNKEVANSRTPTTPSAKPRVPIIHKHTREVDSFYDLPSNEIKTLPPIIQEQLQRTGHKPRLRVTTDEKTNEVIAKIIKVRIQDMNIYCPAYLFDYRISVSAEMNWDGDLDALLAASAPERDGSKPARRKDRMSYRHCRCQIDLTQVKVDRGAPLHELEVELSAREVQRQGRLVVENKPNQYEDLVKGFVDDVRILVRTLNPNQPWK